MLYSFACLGSAVILVLLSHVFNAGILSFFALFYFIVFCLVLAKQYPEAFVLLLWFIFLRFTTMVSGFAIENGAFMIEVLEVGIPTGAFSRLALLYTIVIFSAIAILAFFLKFVPLKPSDRQFLLVQYWVFPVWITTLLLCFAMFGLGLKTGFPLLEGIDRMVYRETMGGRSFAFFLTNRNMFAALLGVVFTLMRDSRKLITLGLLILLFLTSILFAEKFTSLASMLIYFVTPSFLLQEKAREQMAGRLLLLGAVIAMVTLPMLLIVYSQKHPESALEGVKTRAAAQAQIWYLADRDVDDLFRLDTERVMHNLGAMRSTKPYAYSGTYPYLGVGDFMARHMERPRYRAYKKGGVSLTMGTEGYLLTLFGWIGMIPAYWILMLVYCAHLAYLAFGIRSLNPFRIILASKLLVWSGYGLNQGYFWFILGVKSCILMGLVIAFEILLAMGRKGFTSPHQS